MKHVSHTALGLALLTVGWAATAFAQTPGDCPRSLGEAYLDVGNVRARILNTGGLFFRGVPNVYEVPKGGGIHALFASSIWLGGLVDGELRMSATRYGEWEFWAGPLDEQANPPIDCARYDRLYNIYRDDIIAYNATGRLTADLAAWPVDLGAPVVDGDGIEGNYNLEGGDRPALIGDQMIWWVMNDVGNIHRSSDAPPMGMEIHATAFAFRRSSYINEVTFYRYVLHYKGAAPLEKAYFGLFSDPDLGNFDDDYVGSDSTLHLAFVYNADNLDESRSGYGVAPPALGYTFLRSTVADHDGRDNDRDGATDEPGEMHGMTSFLTYFGGGCVICDPRTAQDYYFYMQARWKDGRPLTVGGNGHGFSETPTKFSFSGDPTTDAFWSERNLDGQGSPQDPADRRFIAASGPFTMQPGETAEYLFAIVWARGTNHLDSVRELKKATARLREVADEILQVDLPPQPAPQPAPSYGLGFVQNFPNPFSTATTIRYSLPKAMRIRLKVFDVLGRTVATLVDAQQDGGLYEVPFDGAGLPDGVYFYRIEMDHLRFTKPMMLAR